MAVEKARRIVKENNEMILKLKEDSNIQPEEDDTFIEASNFSYEDSYAFDLYKIKSRSGFRDFFKDIFGGFGADLPAPTKVVVWISDSLRAYFLHIAVCIGGIVWAVKKYAKTEKGIKKLDDNSEEILNK